MEKKLGVKLFEATNKSVSWKEQMSQKTLLEQIANKDEEWESKSDLRRKKKCICTCFIREALQKIGKIKEKVLNRQPSPLASRYI